MIEPLEYRSLFEFDLNYPFVRGTVPLDEVLNAIGAITFPHQWGLHSSFTEMPLLRDDKGLFRIKRNDEFEAIPITPELESVSDMYEEVIRQLTQSVRLGEVRLVGA